eukprot:5625177-Lingulodinium_polyedra.AAC.1
MPAGRTCTWGAPSSHAARAHAALMHCPGLRRPQAISRARLIVHSQCSCAPRHDCSAPSHGGPGTQCKGNAMPEIAWPARGTLPVET